MIMSEMPLVVEVRDVEYVSILPEISFPGSGLERDSFSIYLLSSLLGVDAVTQALLSQRE